MPDTPTPGQVAYDAYWRVHAKDGLWHAPPPFAQLQAITRQSWEAAAQAVRAHPLPGDTSWRCPVCGAHDLASRPPGLTADGEVHRDMTCEACGATWVNVYTFAETRYVTPQEEPPHA